MTNSRLLKPHLKALGVALFLLVGAQAAAQQASYSDLNPEHWAYDAVSELSTLGILTGYPDGRFDGTRAATRYEIAVIASRLLARVGTATSSAGPDNLSSRLGRVETALEGAASLGYTQRLEDRIVALEVALNTQTGQDSFPAAQDRGDDTSALTPPPKNENNMASATISANDAPTDAITNTVRLSSRPEHPFYVGISPGLISTAGDVYLGLQTGFDGLLGPVGPALRLTFNGSNRELRFAFDALGKVDLPIEDLKLYAGLGLGATVRPVGSSLLLEAPFGGEVLITERVGLFLQLTTSYGFAPINDVSAEVSTGLNLRF